MLGLARTNLKDIDAHYYTRKEKEGKKNERTPSFCCHIHLYTTI